MHISVVLGTAREGRHSEKVARAVFSALEKRTEATAAFIDVRDCLTTFHTTRYDETTGKGMLWYESAMKSDGFVFVLPEYNRGYPGEWKLLLDSLYKNAYMGKVAGLVGVSSGQFGGVRAIEQAILTLSNRGMYVIKDALHFPFVDTHFDTEGRLIGEEQIKRVETFADAFLNTVTKYR
jgi:NAD(P)H-dependent FMN reductase